jgi:hypothetical protein
MTALPLRAERIRLTRNGAVALVRWNPRQARFECQFESGEPWQSFGSWDAGAEVLLCGLSQRPYAVERR